MADNILPEEILKLSRQLVMGEIILVNEVYPVIFDFQSKFNPVYRSYLKQLKFDLKYPELEDIPFLPITFFKNFRITSCDWQSKQCSDPALQPERGEVVIILEICKYIKQSV